MISAKEKAILVVSFSNDAHWSMQLNICNKTCALSAKKKLLQQSQIQFHVCVKPNPPKTDNLVNDKSQCNLTDKVTACAQQLKCLLS